MLADPKSAKKLLDLTVFFALLVSAGVKAAHRMLMKLTPNLFVGGHGQVGIKQSKKEPFWNLGQRKDC